MASHTEVRNRISLRILGHLFLEGDMVKKHSMQSKYTFIHKLPLYQKLKWMRHGLGRSKYVSTFYLLIIPLLSHVTDWKCCERIEIILKIFLLPQNMSEMSVIAEFKNFHITEQWFFCDQWAMYFISGGNIINTLIHLFWFNLEHSKTLFKTEQPMELFKDGESKLSCDKNKNVLW